MRPPRHVPTTMGRQRSLGSSTEPGVPIALAGEPHRMRWLVRLIVFVLAVAAVHEMRDRQRKVIAIGEDLSDQRRGIEAAETELDATDGSIDDAESRVRELDARITAIEHEHPGGIPASLQPEYTRLVEEHNDAVAVHNDVIARQR